ncbi:hypothetical protein L3Q82_004515 [Scortum barcoo]|uniref:Uncharacterized protein n=1 Tax=Scortum barcoo TaxID=214431 RepID=A0ACB8VHM5_9TELE|nr:hypothetical protein L3Q82_004515 [Scortum barcoo]
MCNTLCNDSKSKTNSRPTRLSHGERERGPSCLACPISGQGKGKDVGKLPACNETLDITSQRSGYDPKWFVNQTTRSSGQVMDSCEDMKPHHSGLSPQRGPLPFTVTTDQTSYRVGEAVKVQLQAPASTPFIGFLLQAREVGGQSPVGSFALTTGAARHLTCSQRPKSISNTDCGVSKVCFSQPPNCDPTGNVDCYFMSAMMLSPSDTAVRYEMTGPSDGYISFGFSDDQMMPIRTLQAFVGFVSIWPSVGQMDSVRQIQFHTGTFVSTHKVDISRPQFVRKAEWPHIIKAHGALMLIAWMTTGSLGMMVARYLKGVAKGQNLCGKDIWFLVHVTVMSVTVAATIIAFILSFSYVKSWSGVSTPNLL